MNQTKRKPLSLSDTKKLYGKAAGRCAFPACQRELVLDATKSDSVQQIGETAHIIPHSAGGPATYQNSILLCPTCHRVVDAQPDTYPHARLKEIKEKHESWVQSSLTAAMLEVGFPELESIAKEIAGGASSPSPNRSMEDFTVTFPREKMARNGLTNQVEQLILVGMAQKHQVSDFLQRFSMADPAFPEHLKSGFLDAYKKYREQGLTGDALFEALREFASGGSADFKRQAAGLAVLVYLFEDCEVFEK